MFYNNTTTEKKRTTADNYEAEKKIIERLDFY